MKKGFTLIELLAVIIILAVIALIVTPTVLKVVDSAKESGRKSSISGYADAIKLLINEKMFENKGSSPVIDTTFLNNLDYQGERVICDEVKSTNNYGIILKSCKVEKSDSIYCFAKGKVYNCEDEEFINIYSNISDNNDTPTDAIFDSGKGINKPQLTEGMTPIKWIDGVETVTTASDSEWYDYNNKMWANAKTEDGSYWVWIPRYAYKITSGWHTSTTGTIDIKFLKSDTTENSSGTTIQTSGYDVDGTNTSNAYFLHPAFQNETGNTKYGFWMAKFEASVSDTNDLCYTNASPTNCDKTTLTPKIVPNVSSWRYTNIGNQFTVSQNMAVNSSYGWSSETVDTHMMTNYEWGAVAYLTQSSYGKDSEVWINFSSSFITGCSGDSVSDTLESGCRNIYNTETGMNASTTGNITGIYDMSGGADEYVAAYVNNGHSYLTRYGNSIINAANNKNVYNVTVDGQETNYDTNKNIYGDAVYETSSTGINGEYSWNNDGTNMPASSRPWFIRGGSNSSSYYAGVFSFTYNYGNTSSIYSFRPVVLSTQ